MHRYALVLAALGLALTACGGRQTEAQAPPPPAPSSPPPSTSATPTTSSSPSARPTAPPSSNVRDCFDADCTLLLTKPATIPLDAGKFHYSSMRVTAISADSLSYSVSYPNGGSASSTVGVGLAGSSFGFRGSPAVEVGLTLVDGKPALVLQPGEIT